MRALKPSCHKCKSADDVRAVELYDGDSMVYNLCKKCRMEYKYPKCKGEWDEEELDSEEEDYGNRD